MTRGNSGAEETVRKVPNVQYVTRNGYGDDGSGGDSDAHALPHPSLHLSSLQTDEIRLHSASSHIPSSSDPHLQVPLSNPYQGLQDTGNPHHPGAVAGGNDPALPSCHTMDDPSHLVLHDLAIDGSNRFLLYTFTIFIAIIVFINSALIIWIMIVMSVSTVCVFIYYTQYIRNTSSHRLE